MVGLLAIQQKKGWIRILEAVIAILILSSVLIYLTVKNQAEVRDKQTVQRISDLQNNILQEIASSASLRNATITNNKTALEEFISFNLDRSLNYTFGLCEINAPICNPSWPYVLINTNNEVFAQERIISSTLDKYAPKLLRLYVWKN